MSSGNPDFLYEFMPAVYRRRDISERFALRALFRALQPQFDDIYRNIGELYDNWFAETCADWILPYIADLLATRTLPRPNDGDPRRLTANAIAYRRRKGTIAAAQAYASDQCGWSVRAIDYSRRVLQNVTVGDVRLAGRAVSVRNLAELEALDGWDDGLAHGFRVNHTYTMRDVGVFAWRLKSFPIERGSPREVMPACFTFDPSGIDVPLFTRVDDLSADVPEPFTRERLRDGLILARRGAASALPFAIESNGEAVGPNELVAADLTNWEFPPFARADLIAVDPLLGRMRAGPDCMALPDCVSYCYGAAGPVGGGSYPRTEPSEAPWNASLRIMVCRDARDESAGLVRSVGAAFDAARDEAARRVREGLEPISALIVEIIDSVSYDEGVSIGPGDLPARAIALRARSGQRPALLRGLSVAIAPHDYLLLAIDGIRLDGALAVSGDADVLVADATILPAARSAAVRVSGARTTVRMTFARSIVGSIEADDARLDVKVIASILYGPYGPVVTASLSGDVAVSASRTSMLGAVNVTELHAHDTIFAGPIALQRPKQSDVAHCALELSALGDLRARACTFPDVPPDAWFVSQRFGAAAFGSLDPAMPPEIFSGASDGMVIGAFHELGLPVRQQALHDAIEAMIPFGLGIRIRYET
jgi:hypothetical protein